MDVPENANEKCPGVLSKSAGKSKACEGCTNENICKTSVKKDDADIDKIREKLSVRYKILILSGKGGVGKSTFSTQFSWHLAQNKDNQVGLLDIDICGPSIPIIMGVEKEIVHQSSSGWEPVFVDDNLAVMSIGFLLENKDDAVIWRGDRKAGMIKQFLRDVDWGYLDYLVVDTPPGTSDEHLSIVTYLKSTGIDGAIIVTTPQDVSLIDVRKEISFCKKVGIPIIGVVENMSGFICPKCSTKTEIFYPTSGGGEKMSKDMGVEFLGKIPLDPRIARACDEGKSYLDSYPESIGCIAFNTIFERILQNLKLKKTS